MGKISLKPLSHELLPGKVETAPSVLFEAFESKVFLSSSSLFHVIYIPEIIVQALRLKRGDRVQVALRKLPPVKSRSSPSRDIHTYTHKRKEERQEKGLSDDKPKSLSSNNLNSNFLPKPLISSLPHKETLSVKKSEYHPEDNLDINAKKSKKPKCYYPGENGLCLGLWSNEYLYRKCRNCIYCPVNLCENCKYSYFSGPHMACRLMPTKQWIPQSRGIMRLKEKGGKYRYLGETQCSDYQRRSE